MYKIEQVSRKTGLSQKRIRDYEKEGLIKPVRDANTNDRLFSDFDVKQIKRIKSLIHERGFTIPALKQLFLSARRKTTVGMFSSVRKKRIARHLRIAANDAGNSEERKIKPIMRNSVPSVRSIW
jgi:DNA-binding transcriptional MerR regulator